MKFRTYLVLSAVLALAVVPFSSVNAYFGADGLLSRYFVTDGTVFDPSAKTFNAGVFTDNNTNTDSLITGQGRWIIFEKFSSPMDLTAYQYYNYYGARADLVFFDDNDTEISRIRQNNLTPTGAIVSIDVKGVSRVAMLLTQVNIRIAEIDVRGVVAVDTTPPLAPSDLVSLAGDGTVTLNWSAVSSSDLAGYNVYRDEVKVNSSLLSSPVFTASTLNNRAYSWYVTAVDTSGNESEPSNSVTTNYNVRLIYVNVGSNSVTPRSTLVNYGSPRSVNIPSILPYFYGSFAVDI